MLWLISNIFTIFNEILKKTLHYVVTNDSYAWYLIELKGTNQKIEPKMG